MILPLVAPRTACIVHNTPRLLNLVDYTTCVQTSSTINVSCVSVNELVPDGGAKKQEGVRHHESDHRAEHRGPCTLLFITHMRQPGVGEHEREVEDVAKTHGMEIIQVRSRSENGDDKPLPHASENVASKKGGDDAQADVEQKQKDVFHFLFLIRYAVLPHSDSFPPYKKGKLLDQILP